MLSSLASVIWAFRLATSVLEWVTLRSVWLQENYLCLTFSFITNLLEDLLLTGSAKLFSNRNFTSFLLRRFPLSIYDYFLFWIFPQSPVAVWSIPPRVCVSIPPSLAFVMFICSTKCCVSVPLTVADPFHQLLCICSTKCGSNLLSTFFCSTNCCESVPDYYQELTEGWKGWRTDRFDKFRFQNKFRYNRTFNCGLGCDWFAWYLDIIGRDTSWNHLLQTFTH